MGDRISKPNDVSPDVPFTKWTPPVAKGTRMDKQVRCAIGFDEDTFAQIREMAIKNKCSFAAMVRLLVEWGLESIDKQQIP